jgi:hypothetical protein
MVQTFYRLRHMLIYLPKTPVPIRRFVTTKKSNLAHVSATSSKVQQNRHTIVCVCVSARTKVMHNIHTAYLTYFILFHLIIFFLLLLLAFTTHLWLLASSFLRFRNDTYDTTQSVRFLSTSDQPVAETSTWQTHNTHNKQTRMPLAGFEPGFPADGRLQTHALDRSASHNHLRIQFILPTHFQWRVTAPFTI